jgi:hypothetical protein
MGEVVAGQTTAPEPRRAGPAAISVRDLRMSYGEFEAVRGISFEVRAGEVFAFLGPKRGRQDDDDRDPRGLLRAQGGAHPVDFSNLAVLVVWGAGASVIAVRSFRWAPQGNG